MMYPTFPGLVSLCIFFIIAVYNGSYIDTVPLWDISSSSNEAVEQRLLIQNINSKCQVLMSEPKNETDGSR